MSTSFKNKPKQIISDLNTTHQIGNATLVGYGYVTSVFTNSKSVEVEGCITVEIKGGKAVDGIIYPINYHTRQVPMIGEYVPVYSKGAIGKYVYGPPINIHNFPTHNISTNDIGDNKGYEEPLNVNPMPLFQGDIIREGRNGQSIRFSKTFSDDNLNPWSSSTTQKEQSVIAIVSGQESTEDGSNLLQENPDKDPASIYLLENGKLRLNQATKVDEYEGNQALILSDRILLHTRENSIILRSEKESIKLISEKEVELADQKWQTTLTEVVDLIEILVNGGNTAGGAPVTGINAEAFVKLQQIKARLTNG